MKRILFVFVLLISSAFLIGCVTNSDVNRQGSKLEILGSDSHDWGDINIKGGDVENVFKVKNSGDEDLVVETATTSCMCTTASVILASGETSPIFGMHGNSQWGGIVKPNEEFDVSVVFDPMAHGPNATGSIMRTVQLETSVGGVELTVQGDVLSEEEFNQKS